MHALELLIMHCTIQYACIVNEVSEGMQGVSWMTAREYIIIKYSI